MFVRGEVDQVRETARRAAAAGISTPGGGDRPARRSPLHESKCRPDRFPGSGLSWKQWSYQMQLICGAHSPLLAQAMHAVEEETVPVTDLAVYGADADGTDNELKVLPASCTRGEAAGVLLSSHQALGLDQWRCLKRHFDPASEAQSMRDYRALIQPKRIAQYEDLPGAITVCEALERKIGDGMQMPIPDGFKHVALRDLCPAALAEQIGDLSHQLTLAASVKDYILACVSDRTAGSVPMALGNLDGSWDDWEEEVEELNRLDRPKGKGKCKGGKGEAGGGKGKNKRECYRCGRPGHMRADCQAKAHVDGGSPRPPPTRRVQSLEGDAGENVCDEADPPRELGG